jgi:hypothetical protein
LPAPAGKVKPISGGAKIKHCGFGSLVKGFNVAYQVFPTLIFSSSCQINSWQIESKAPLKSIQAISPLTSFFLDNSSTLLMMRCPSWITLVLQMPIVLGQSLSCISSNIFHQSPLHTRADKGAVDLCLHPRSSLPVSFALV